MNDLWGRWYGVTHQARLKDYCASYLRQVLYQRSHLAPCNRESSPRKVLGVVHNCGFLIARQDARGAFAFVSHFTVHMVTQSGIRDIELPRCRRHGHPVLFHQADGRTQLVRPIAFLFWGHSLKTQGNISTRAQFK